MFSLSELAPMNHHQSRSKLLKPWWEVFMDYLVVLMLMTSVLACTEQLSRDRVVCIPLDTLVTANTSGNVGLTPSSKPPTQVPHNISPEFHSTARGRRTHLVYQQYVYISQVLYLKMVQQIRSIMPTVHVPIWQCSVRSLFPMPPSGQK